MASERKGQFGIIVEDRDDVQVERGHLKASQKFVYVIVAGGVREPGYFFSSGYARENAQLIRDTMNAEMYECPPHIAPHCGKCSADMAASR